MASHGLTSLETCEDFRAKAAGAVARAAAGAVERDVYKNFGKVPANGVVGVWTSRTRSRPAPT